MISLSFWSNNLLKLWDYEQQPIKSPLWFPLFIAVVMAVYGYALLKNGHLMATVAPQDNIIFLDGIYRVWFGQVPHLDFESALGSFNFFGPALFGVWTDSPEMALLLYNVAIIAFMLLCAAWVCYSRLGIVSSVLLILYVASIAGAPMNVGADSESISHHMLYNRFGWATVMIVALMVIPSQYHRVSYIIDTSLLALLAVFMLYLKISYFLVLIGLLLTFAVYYVFFRWAIIVVLAVSLLCGAFLSLQYPGINAGYLSDLVLVAGLSSEMNLIKPLTRNFLEVLPVLIMLLTTHVFIQGKGLGRFNQTFWIPFGMLVASLMIIENNAQSYGLPLLFSALIVQIYFYRNPHHESYAGTVNKTELSTSEKVLFLCLLVALSLPVIFHRQAALERYQRLSNSEYPAAIDSSLSHFLMIPGKQDRYRIDLTAMDDMSRQSILDGLTEATPTSARLFKYQQALTISEGVIHLRQLMNEFGKGPVVSFDFSNPFSWLLDIEPPIHDYLWHHPGRNISGLIHRPASEFLASAQYVMLPKYPMDKRSPVLMESIARDYLYQHFTKIEYDYWTIWLRKPL